MADYAGQEFIQSTVDFFKAISEKMDSILLDSVANTYNSVAKATYPIVVGFVVLWVCYFAITLIANPRKSGSIKDFMWKFGKIIFISAIAFAWGNFYELIADPVMNGANDFIGKAAGNDAEQLLLDNVGKIFDFITRTNDKMTTGLDVGAAFVVAIITALNFLAGALQLASYFFIVIESKILIAVLLIVAPIFLSFLMFDSTRSYFQNWISAILQPIITLLLMAIVMSLMGNVINYSLKAVMPDGQYNVNITSAFLALIISIFTIAFIWKAPQIASNLVSNGFGLNSDGKFKPAQQFKDWNDKRKGRALQKDSYRQMKIQQKGNKDE